MQQYPAAFLRFLERMATEHAAEGEELNWLLEVSGKELRALEREFRDHMSQFPKQDPPWLVEYDALLEIFHGF
jgi:hypothetical protein